jgi:hypothetical protein
MSYHMSQLCVHYSHHDRWGNRHILYWHHKNQSYDPNRQCLCLNFRCHGHTSRSCTRCWGIDAPSCCNFTTVLIVHHHNRVQQVRKASYGLVARICCVFIVIVAVHCSGVAPQPVSSCNNLRCDSCRHYERSKCTNNLFQSRVCLWYMHQSRCPPVRWKRTLRWCYSCLLCERHHHCTHINVLCINDQLLLCKGHNRYDREERDYSCNIIARVNLAEITSVRSMGEFERPVWASQLSSVEDFKMQALPEVKGNKTTAIFCNVTEADL